MWYNILFEYEIFNRTKILYQAKTAINDKLTDMSIEPLSHIKLPLKNIKQIKTTIDLHGLCRVIIGNLSIFYWSESVK